MLLGLTRAWHERPLAGSHRRKTSAIVSVSDHFRIRALAALAVPLLESARSQGAGRTEEGTQPKQGLVPGP